MSVEISYSQARENLANLLDRVEHDREIVVVTRHGRQAVVMVAADEFHNMQETLRVLLPPEHGLRLLTALERSKRGEGVPMTMEQLRQEVGLGGSASDDDPSGIPDGLEALGREPAANGAENL